jgi:hypothetical protein
MKANGQRRQHQLAEFCSVQEIRNGESALWSGTMKIRDIFTVQRSTFSKNQKKCRSLHVFADADRRYAARDAVLEEKRAVEGSKRSFLPGVSTSQCLLRHKLPTYHRMLYKQQGWVYVIWTNKQINVIIFRLCLKLDRPRVRTANFLLIVIIPSIWEVLTLQNTHITICTTTTNTQKLHIFSYSVFMCYLQNKLRLRSWQSVTQIHTLSIRHIFSCIINFPMKINR